MAKCWIIESKPKRGGKWRKAGPYIFRKRSDFGTLKSIRRSGSPKKDYRFKKVRCPRKVSFER